MDLRDYAKEVEVQLIDIERASIQDCIVYYFLSFDSILLIKHFIN